MEANNWQLYRLLTEISSATPLLPLLLSILRLIYTQALLNYTLNSFILKEKMVFIK